MSMGSPACRKRNCSNSPLPWKNIPSNPLGTAIVKRAEADQIDLTPVTDFKSLTGMGIAGRIAETSYSIGNLKFMDSISAVINDQVKTLSDTLAEAGKTPMYLAQGDSIIGIIAVADTLKKNSKAAVHKLNQMGVKTIMLTGDNKRTAEAIGRQLEISEVISEVMPEDKIKMIDDLKSRGFVTGMVGDGINDAPALAAADVGLAIGNGTDVAIESADIVLMHNDIMDVPTAIDLSRKTIANIKQNLFWAFIYNVVGIPVAMGVLYLFFDGPLLNPIIAAMAMSMSSVSVLTNALRLRSYQPFKEAGE